MIFSCGCKKKASFFKEKRESVVVLKKALRPAGTPSPIETVTRLCDCACAGTALVATVAALVLGAGGREARAEPIWLEAHYPYTIIENPLKDVLLDFGSNVGVPVQVSDAVKGWARGPLASGSGRTFLDRLSDAHRLDWYFDGKVLHISDDNEAGERLVSIRGIRPESIEQSLRSLELADPRYPLRVSQQQNVAIVAGPPRYVALVENAIDALRPRPKRAVEVIRGRGS